MCSSDLTVDDLWRSLESNQSAEPEVKTSVEKQKVVDHQEEWEHLAELDADDLCSLMESSKKAKSEVKPATQHIHAPSFSVKIVKESVEQQKKHSANTSAKSGKQPKQSVKQVKKEQPKPAANVTAKKSVQQPDAVVEFRFQGKIKCREQYKTLHDGTRVKARGSKMNFGFIEVNPMHTKTLQDHPDWNHNLLPDVFWHWTDCKYPTREGQWQPEPQLGGDIVTFTVALRPDGAALQAKNVELKKHAEWWHATASQVD